MLFNNHMNVTDHGITGYVDIKSDIKSCIMTQQYKHKTKKNKKKMHCTEQQ